MTRLGGIGNRKNGVQCQGRQHPRVRQYKFAGHGRRGGPSHGVAERNGGERGRDAQQVVRQRSAGSQLDCNLIRSTLLRWSTLGLSELSSPAQTC